MIPNQQQIQNLWDTHHLPPEKRVHSLKVAKLAVWLAHSYQEVHPEIHIDTHLLEAAALLHDIDKKAVKKEDEHHPDAGVRILTEAGMQEVADIVRTHPLHAILDQNIAPRTIEEKLLYLSDKMVKYEIITVDARFNLWRSEDLPPQGRVTLEAAYPIVKALEREIFTIIKREPNQAGMLANGEETSTMKLT